MEKYAILVVDDEPIVTRALKTQLENYFGNEIEIGVVQNAEECFSVMEECIQEIEVPLVICDYRMPGLRGDQLIIELQKKYPETLSVLLTGQIDVEGMGNIVNHAKIFRYIAKPWNETDLLLTVREAIHLYSLTKTVSHQSSQIVRYAFANAHNVRGPLARIMGLVTLIKRDPSRIQCDGLIDKLEQSAYELDNVVREITRMLEEKGKK